MVFDSIMTGHANLISGIMRYTGSGYSAFSRVMRVNPFFSHLSDHMDKYGRFLMAKGQHIGPAEWQTKNQVVFTGYKVALRKFNDDTKGNPLLIVAPEAGHNSQIVDYGPDQSLVACAKQFYHGDIYVVDKLPAELRHTDYTLDDSIQSLHACLNYIGEPVNLVGLCQGGWQSAIFTALFPEAVKTLTLAAAPIDFHAGDSQIKEWATTLPMSFYKSMVRLGNGNMPGSLIVHGFMMMNAVDRFIGDDIRLLENIDAPGYLERHRRFNQWYKQTQPLPGKMYLQIVKELFKDNKLVLDKLHVLGETVKLANIRQPLYLLAGTKDDITPPPQLFAITHHASSLSVTEMTAPAGHIGVFMAKGVIKNYWSTIFSELSRYVDSPWYGPALLDADAKAPSTA